VTAVDWAIVAFTVLLAFYGYTHGFIVGALSLAGFAAGAFLGTRLGPLVLPGGSQSPYAPLFGLVGALLVGGLLAAGLEGIGVHARAALRFPGFRTADGLLGAAFTGLIALGIAWIVGAVVLQSVGSLQLRQDIQRSLILRELNAVLPPSGAILNALARFDPLPAVHGQAADVAPPNAAILRAPRVVGARAGVVRVIGTACGLGIEGSGWVAQPGIVITNAHVVAGETDTLVQAGGFPPGLPARAIDFDPHDDVAILAVPGLDQPSLTIASAPRSGSAAAILGFPLDGGFHAEPGRIGPTRLVSSQDAYGNGPVLRSVTQLRGHVQAGNSGGPIVDAAGAVLGTVFAAVVGSREQGGFAVPNAVVAHQLTLALAHRTVGGTGACAG
jgi:S1-C subfamily serine protease